MQKVGNPVPSFYDITGRLADGGELYYGVANGDPETDPIDTFWDSALTILATQPIRTVGGRIVNGTTPASVFVAESDYSYRSKDSLGNLVDYEPSVFAPGATFQPLDADLTTISGQANTAYGLGLLAQTAAPTAGVGIKLTEDGGGHVTAIAADTATAAQFQAATANKVLIGDQVWAGAATVPLTDVATIETDMSTGLNFSVTLAGNRTLDNPTNAKAGQSGCIAITQDATGSRTLAYAANWKFAGGSAPTLSTAASAEDLLFYQVFSSTFIFASLIKNVH